MNDGSLIVVFALAVAIPLLFAAVASICSEASDTLAKRRRARE